jgi:hypothetical protein
MEAQAVHFISEISEERAEHAIEIILQAEESLATRDLTPRSGVSAGLVLRILEYGSKLSDERVQQCWAGILASSCLEGTQDDATGRYAVLLSKLDRDHISVLTVACTRAMRAGWQEGFVFASELYAPLEEITNVAAIRNPVAVERTLNHLHQLGLMEKTVRPLGCAELDQVNITPTSMGLKLYARCCGDSELPKMLKSSALVMAS